MKNTWPTIIRQFRYRAPDGYLHVRQLVEWPDGRREATDICLYVRA